MYDHLYVCMWVEDSASIIHDIPGSKKKKIEIDKREGKTNRYRGRKIIYTYSLFSIISYNIIFCVLL